MNKLTISKEEKIIYRFLEICKFFINHNDDQYFMFYTGSSLDFQHPYASCRLSVKELTFDMFSGMEPGLYSIRQTPKAVYELNKIGGYIPEGLKYINFSSALERAKYALSLNKDEQFKASMITEKTGIIFKDDDVKVLNKFPEMNVSYIENSNVLMLHNEEEFCEDVYVTEIVINPQNDLLNTYQLELGEVYAKE